MTQPAAEETPNTMDGLGELMFGGADSLNEHLTVINKHMGEGPGFQRRSEVLEYAREHLIDGPLIDVELRVAEAAADSLAVPSHQRNLDSSDKRNNGRRVGEVLEAVVKVSDSPLPLEEGTYTRSLSLMNRIQELEPGLDYRVETVEAAPQSDEQPEPRHPRFWKLADTAIEAAVRGIDRLDKKGKIQDRFDEQERQEKRTRGLFHADDVSQLAVGLIDRAVREIHRPEDLADVFPDGVHHAYLEQALYVSDRSRKYQVPQAQYQGSVDMLVVKALEHVGVGTPDAVRTYLDLYHDKDGLGYSNRRGLLRNAVEVTERSSHEPVIERKPRTILGFLSKVMTTDSPFESRRRVLRGDLLDNFTGYLADHPDHLGRVAGLYDSASSWDEFEEGESIWYDGAKLVADHGFKNGHYTSEGLKLTQATLDRFGRVAPEEGHDRARQLVKSRLKTSTPGV